MNSKSAKISALAAPFVGQDADPRYLAWFACFNGGQYFEAHEVLEDMWLPLRHLPEGDFYKGLIQLAGAFVHLQKNRPQPAAALFRLADANLGRFPDAHERLPVAEIRSRIAGWLHALNSSGFTANPLADGPRPSLHLSP